MASGSVSWDDTMQRKTISGLSDKILEMESAKNKMIPALDELRPNWKTEASTKTINDLEAFLNDDFKEFINAFNITVNSLENVRGLSVQMDQHH